MAQPSDVTALLREASRAGTHERAQELVAAAENVRGQLTAQAAAAREVDLANAIVMDHLTPALVHEHHTAATDWVGSLDTSGGTGVEQEMVAQGSLWYGRLHELVKADQDEFEQQAAGLARRLAGAFGEQADVAEAALLTHVGALWDRDRRAGLIVMAGDQPEDGGAQPGGLGVGPNVEFGLPGELTSSDRAPAMQVMENGTAGTDGWSSPLQLPGHDVDEANNDADTSRDRAKAAVRKQATGPHRVIADEHDADAEGPTGWHHRAGDIVHVQEFGTFGDTDGTNWAMVRHPRSRGDSSFIHADNLEPLNERNASMPQHTAACPACSGCEACGGTHRVAVRTQAASGVDQIDQIIDPNNQPKQTPYPTEVAFAWEMPNDSGQAIKETEQQLAQREQLKGASRAELARRAAHQAAQVAYAAVMRTGGYDDSGWAGDMGAGGNQPGMQDTGNPGPPDSLPYVDPVYGHGGDQGQRDLQPYGEDEANDYTNNPGMNYQPGQPTQMDLAGRQHQVGQPTARRQFPRDPEILKAERFIAQREQFLAGRS